MKDLSSTMSLFWVQIHGLTFGLLTPNVAFSIGETLGEVQQISNQSEMIGGNFLRVRVDIFPNHYIVEGNFLLMMIQRNGFLLSMNTFLIFATSVEGLLMMIMIVFSGCKVKVL